MLDLYMRKGQKYSLFFVYEGQTASVLIKGKYWQHMQENASLHDPKVCSFIVWCGPWTE